MSLVRERFASILYRSWWVLLLRGLAAIAFGVMTFFWPGLSLAALILLFGAYALADGVLTVFAAVVGRKEHAYWWVMLLEGLLGIGIGILVFFAPGLTAFAVLLYIAIRAIATGILQIAAAIRLRHEIQGEWMLILAGLASVLFGIVLIARPGAGALAVLWLIASFAVVFGVLLVILAFKARRFAGALAHAHA
jgi:uncharacterized membrane protein HdeD (DUF308 family)